MIRGQKKRGFLLRGRGGSGMPGLVDAPFRNVSGRGYLRWKVSWQARFPWGLV
jgi:hypothetical protein